MCALCVVMLQNVQPPKQPRMVTIECLTVSYAGMRSAPYPGCGKRVNGRSYRPSISASSSGNAGELKYTACSPCAWSSGRPLCGLVSS